MRTNNNEIQSHVDTLTQEEEERSRALKKQLEELDPKKDQSGGAGSVIWREKVTFLVDKKQFEHTIPSTGETYNQILSKVFGPDTANNFFGYMDKENNQIVLRNNRDVMCCLREHFATPDKNITFISLRPQEFQPITTLNFAGECVDHDAVHFKLATAGKGNILIFTSIPKNSSFQDGFNALKAIKPSLQRIYFSDSDNDSIFILNDTDWEYFLNECEVSYNSGKFILLYAD